jgi:hypothetical protein
MEIKRILNNKKNQQKQRERDLKGWGEKKERGILWEVVNEKKLMK